MVAEEYLEMLINFPERGDEERGEVLKIVFFSDVETSTIILELTFI